MTIRPINLTDIPTLFEVRIATWHNEHGDQELTAFGITHHSVRDMFLSGTHNGWVCTIDSRVVGFAMGNRETGEMWVIAVLKEYEGRGIGRQLLSRVEQWLAEQGWHEIWLTTDVDDEYRAVRFYKHLGWEDWKLENGDRFMRKLIESDKH